MTNHTVLAIALGLVVVLMISASTFPRMLYAQQGKGEQNILQPEEKQVQSAEKQVQSGFQQAEKKLYVVTSAHVVLRSSVEDTDGKGK